MVRRHPDCQPYDWRNACRFQFVLRCVNARRNPEQWKPVATIHLLAPDGARGAGSLQVTVQADRFNQIVESNAGGTAESNNQLSATAAASLAPYPDLQPSGITVVGNPSLQSGANVTINWNAVNNGNAPVTSSFYERVTVVNTTTGQTLVSNDIYYDISAPGNGAIHPAVRRIALTPFNFLMARRAQERYKSALRLTFTTTSSSTTRTIQRSRTTNLVRQRRHRWPHTPTCNRRVLPSSVTHRCNREPT